MVKVVTVATNPKHPFLQRFLVGSCAALGLHLVILEPRESRNWQGFISKKILRTRWLPHAVGASNLVTASGGGS
jgi:hypothetical protein